MPTIFATLPDGKLIQRKTNRIYTHICAIRWIREGIPGAWSAKWCGNYQLALKVAAYWRKIPKRSFIEKTETQIIPICE